MYQVEKEGDVKGRQREGGCTYRGSSLVFMLSNISIFLLTLKTVTSVAQLTLAGLVACEK